MGLASGFGVRDMGKLGAYREYGTKDLIDIRNEASLQDRCVLGGRR